jgi:hypothetical protein
MFIKVNIKQLLFFLPLISLYLSFSNVYAESYTTGDSNTSISVETNTSGGTTETHISIEANGEKNVIDSNKNGKIEIKINSSSSSSQAKNAITTPGITGIQKKTTAAHSTKKLKKEKKNDIEHLLLRIEHMLKSFFK